MKKSCSSCKYGNNCPYGGSDLYCLKEYNFKDVMELCNLFDSPKTRDNIFENCKRSEDYCCEDYEAIDHNIYFTYNDFGY